MAKFFFNDLQWLATPSVFALISRKYMEVVTKSAEQQG